MSEVLIVNRPVVAQPARRSSATAMVATLSAVGLGVFFWLSSARAAQEESGSTLPPLTAAVTAAAPQDPPAEAAPAPLTAPTTSGFAIPISGSVTPVPSAPLQQPFVRSSRFMPLPMAPATNDPMRERLRAPTLVIDMAQADVPRMPGSSEPTRSDSGLEQRQTNTQPSDSGATARAGADDDDASTPAAGGGNRNLSDTEQFAARVGSEEAGAASARRMGNLDRLVPQGAIIGAVMETALNSDQPGFARALISRDVYSFDGSTVLIPAGSRVIGQYKSGVAQGASRLFVLWTRLIRADGVSINLASPAVDDLGRGGLGGKVNRHYVQRFGGAILTSVLTGGLSALAASRSGGSTIVVNSAGQATTLASQAGQGGDIPPTITTRQGANVRIFVARDLDFTRVGPAR